MCQNATKDKEEVAVNLPCFTNLTVDVNLLNETGPVGENHKYCVTTMAIAGPEYKKCPQRSEKEIDGYKNVLAGTFDIVQLLAYRSTKIIWGFKRVRSDKNELGN